jgi:hypothetical protein
VATLILPWGYPIENPHPSKPNIASVVATSREVKGCMARTFWLCQGKKKHFDQNTITKKDSLIFPPQRGWSQNALNKARDKCTGGETGAGVC